MEELIASVELQRTVFALLSEKYDVFEIAPPNHPKPFILIGDEDIEIVDTKTETRTLHNITLITHTKGTSSIPHKTMNDFVVNSIARKKLTVNGFNVDMQTLGMSVSSKETKTDETAFRTIMTFDITLTKHKQEGDD